MADDPHIVQFFRFELMVEQQSRGTNDAVQRRANLVAHHGKQVRTRATRLLGRVTGGRDFQLVAFPFGESV